MGDVIPMAILDFTYRIFCDPRIEGLIGYRIDPVTAVVFGDPVCAAADKPELAKAFHSFAGTESRGCLYHYVRRICQLGCPKSGSVLIEFGEKICIKSLNNPAERTGSKAILVRKKGEHALREGALVEEYSGDDPDIEKAIEEVATSGKSTSWASSLFSAFTLV